MSEVGFEPTATWTQRLRPLGHPDVYSAELTYHTSHQTQNQSDADEGPVPAMRAAHRHNTQKNEDQSLADAAPHFQEVLDGGVGLVGYVGLHIGPHHRSTRYQPEGTEKDVESSAAELYLSRQEPRSSSTLKITTWPPPLSGDFVIPFWHHVMFPYYSKKARNEHYLSPLICSSRIFPTKWSMKG